MGAPPNSTGLRAGASTQHHSPQHGAQWALLAQVEPSITQ